MLGAASPSLPTRGTKSHDGRSLSALFVALALVLVTFGGCKRDEKGRAKELREVKALEEKGARCFADGRYDCAMEAFAAAAKLQPRRAQLWNQFALSARLRYYVTGDTDFRDQELEALRRAAKLDRGAANVQVNLGTVCWEMGLREEAAQAYRAALELTPKHADAELMRARIQRSTQEEQPDEEAMSPGP